MRTAPNASERNIKSRNKKYTKESVIGYPTRVYAIEGADNIVKSLHESFGRFAIKTLDNFSKIVYNKEDERSGYKPLIGL